MDRRRFFKSLAIGVAAVVVAPKLLVPKSKVDFRTYNMPDGTKITIAIDPRFDTPTYKFTNKQVFWIRFEEWKAYKNFYNI
jgi:hypothetical protein